MAVMMCTLRLPINVVNNDFNNVRFYEATNITKKIQLYDNSKRCLPALLARS